MRILVATITFFIGFSLGISAQTTNAISSKNNSNVSVEKSAKANATVLTTTENRTLNTAKSGLTNTYTKPRKEKSKFNRNPELVSDKKNIQVK